CRTTSVARAGATTSRCRRSSDGVHTSSGRSDLRCTSPSTAHRSRAKACSTTWLTGSSESPRASGALPPELERIDGDVVEAGDAEAGRQAGRIDRVVDVVLVEGLGRLVVDRVGRDEQPARTQDAPEL